MNATRTKSRKYVIRETKNLLNMLVICVYSVFSKHTNENLGLPEAYKAISIIFLF